MFDATLDPHKGMQSRLGIGAVLSIVAHAAVAALVFGIPNKIQPSHVEKPRDLVILDFVPRIAAAELPKPAVQSTEQQPSKPAQRPQSQRVPISNEPKPLDNHVENELPNLDKPAGGNSPTGNTEDHAGIEGSSGASDGKGAIDKTPAIQAPDVPSAPKEYRWTHKMERPVLIAGRAQPAYPRHALQLHREGAVVARCRITAEGTVRDCRILEGDVMLRDGVLETLAMQRYRPVMLDGRPVSVSYDFSFRFKVQ